MANENRGGAARQQPYTLCAAHDRVYARNVDGKLIDLGALHHGEGGACYRLDGNGQSADGFFTEEEALRDLGHNLRFLWLDGQFTALADVRDTVDLQGACQVDIMLDELQPGERAFDATV
jgi:hypothetical protein